MAKDPAMAVVYCRLSYFHGFKPYEGKLNQGNPKYKATLIIDPSTLDGKDSMKKANAALQHVCQENGINFPPKFKDAKRFCLSDGNSYTDEETGEVDPAYEDMKIIGCSNKKRPVIVDRDGTTPLTADDNKPYSGCYAKVAVRFYFTDNGGKGIFAGLEAVQFMKDGENLGGGGVRAEEVFKDESGAEDDDDSPPVQTKAKGKKAPPVDDDDDL